MDPSFEIAISREHGRHIQIFIGNNFFDSRDPVGRCCRYRWYNQKPPYETPMLQDRASVLNLPGSCLTTLEPGARDVLTYPGTRKPLRTALRAKSAAPNNTDGLDVLVQEVIAAITMLPSPIRSGLPCSVHIEKPLAHGNATLGPFGFATRFVEESGEIFGVSVSRWYSQPMI